MRNDCHRSSPTNTALRARAAPVKRIPSFSREVPRSGRPSQSDNCDICLREIIAGTEQLIISDSGQRVAEAITEIEGGTVSPFAEPNTGFLRDRALFGVNRDKLNFEVTQQRIEIASSTLAKPTDQHQARFDS